MKLLTTLKYLLSNLRCFKKLRAWKTSQYTMNFKKRSPNPQQVFKLKKKQFSQNIGYNEEAVILTVFWVQELSVGQSSRCNNYVPCLKIYYMVLHFFHCLQYKSGVIDQGYQNCVTLGSFILGGKGCVRCYPCHVIAQGFQPKTSVQQLAIQFLSHHPFWVAENSCTPILVSGTSTIKGLQQGQESTKETPMSFSYRCS